MQEQTRRAVPSPIKTAANPAPPSIASGNPSESDTANAKTPGSGDSQRSPKSPMSPVQEEIQRVRKQIDDMADQLKEAFKEEKYDSVRELGERKQDLEAKLKSFEERYSNDKHELQGVKVQIEEVEADLKVAFENENYPKVQELGARKEDLKKKLAGLESSFGLHNAVYQVGDRVSVIGLKSPRGGNYNGVVGTITEYMEGKQRYKVSILDDQGDQSQGDKLIAVNGANLKAHDEEAQKCQSKTRQLSGEIKLWFPRKHFGFITPDNKPEGEPDIFFHGTHVENRKAMPIKRFARVRFSVIPAPKGPQARDVTISAYQPEKEAEAEREATAAGNGPTPGEGPGPIPADSRPAAQPAQLLLPRPSAKRNSSRSSGSSYTTPERKSFSLAARQNDNRQVLQQPTPDSELQKKRRGKSRRQRGCRGGKKKRRQKEARARRAAEGGWPDEGPMHTQRLSPPQNGSRLSPPQPQRLPQHPMPGSSPMNPNAGAFNPGGLDGSNRWRRPNGQPMGQPSAPEMRVPSHAPSPGKSKRHPPGFPVPNKPPGLSNISVGMPGGNDIPPVSNSMQMSSGGLPPISGAMQRSYYADNDLDIEAPLDSISPKALFGDQGFTRQPSTTTDDLPSFNMSPLADWGKFNSEVSMHFSDGPLGVATPVSSRADPGSWRPSKQDSPRDRAIRRDHSMNAFRSRGQG